MIPEAILTERELRVISGHHTRDGLSEWLKKNGIPFLTARTGWPRVHLQALEAAMGVRQADAPKVSDAVEFDFESLR